MTITHRRSKTPPYLVWCAMKNRCYNPKVRNFALYGGRGIRVCDRWRNSFENFIADMGERPPHTTGRAPYWLDRIDNARDYEPGNCQWSTARQQQNNRRDNVRLTHDGETRTVSEWNRHLGFPVGVINQRINKLGWGAAKALTTPLRTTTR